MLIEESPSFPARPKNEKFYIKSPGAVGGFFSGQDGAVGDCIYRSILVKWDINAAVAMAGVAGMPDYAERAYKHVASSHILRPEGKEQISGRTVGVQR